MYYCWNIYALVDVFYHSMQQQWIKHDFIGKNDHNKLKSGNVNVCVNSRKAKFVNKIC